ncbi:hypothetical protein [Mycobacteroides abscessus]|uniref:hypothetical protein n=1 Tax=Mycobacteroides abscessus TaxID=36809 RepID=UPI0009268A1C|nr:hypothetical protein [Mycobacteroides abscessus]MBE5451286.1 hypothetical protein [Mycobacteroides abscessus]MDO3212592.1 hypothetical protein [Mycobacteroides abscessus subsp. abscessus]MDO3352061.1 hypothetical protein [Mycobacteroides abscessus subsp. abscessus]PVA12418.1 hypothetical protein DDJ61_22755 [Mycobacteroides abscessus]PVA74407.1 hypothetical protein DDJ76_22550 [Mycobacteroides abscessus]
MTHPNLKDFASPIPDPTPKPEPSGGQYRGLASGIPANPKSAAEGPKTSDTKPDTEQKPDADKSEPKPNRDGKVVADTEPKPTDAADKPAPDPEAKPKPSAASKFMRAAGIPDGYTRSPIKQFPALLKTQAKTGADISATLAGKMGAKGALKTAARLVPGVGAAYSAVQAYQHAKSGDYLGAALNMVGMIPGPIGWVGIAAATAWDMFDLGGGKLGQWSEPDGSTTFILPAAAHDIGGVTALDSQLREAQQLVFSFQDGPKGRVWDSNPPEALRLDGADIKQEITAALGGISDLFAEVDRVMASAGEAYFDEYRSRLQPHLDAMAALKEQVKPFTQQLSNASDGAATAYTAVLDANRAAREQLSNDGKLSDQGPAVSFTSSVAAAGSKVIAADRNISEMFGEPAAVLTAAVATGTGTKVDPEKKATPVQTTPVAQTPVTPTSQTPSPTMAETPTKTNDPLSDLMRALNQQKPVAPTTPSVPNLGSGLGGGSPLGNGGGSPLSTSPSKPLDSGEGKKLDSGRDKKLDDKSERKLDDRDKDKKEEKKATPLSASGTDNAKTPESKLTATEKPGHPAAVPAQPSAAPATNPAAPTAAQGQATQPAASKEVDVKGNKTTFPDAKTAKMAQLLANADPAHPLSLTDAAAQAGLTPPVPGQDPGSQVAPAQAKPGDLLVSGDKKFMLLGDGKFYDLQEYKVVSADQLPQDAGSRGGYFHLNDPSPTGAPGTQPVSGQTAGVDQQVPGGTPPPAAPADASTPPKPTDPAPGAPTAGGVPSAGTPGAPKPAAGGGPASAEATATGTGQSQPSPSTNALDPNAVR